MAGGGSEFDRSQSLTWSFSVLEGVQVKIGDRFRPPKKINLPVGWKQLEEIEIGKFDFTFEEEIRKAAIQELEQQKLQEDHENEEKEKQQAVLASLISDDSENFETQNGQGIGELVNEDRGTSAANDEVHSDLSEAPILEPVRLNSDPVAQKTNAKASVFIDFNFSEFEDNSATPFELVELQTLDDIDELKSVLQPESLKNGPNKKKTSVDGRKPDADIDFSIFDTPVVTNKETSSTRNHQVATASLLHGIEPDAIAAPYPFTATSYSSDVSSRFSSGLPTSVMSSEIPLENRFNLLTSKASSVQNSPRNFLPPSYSVAHTSPNSSGGYGPAAFSTRNMTAYTAVQFGPQSTSITGVRNINSPSNTPVIDSSRNVNGQTNTPGMDSHGFDAKLHGNFNNYGRSVPEAQGFSPAYDVEGLSNFRRSTNLNKSNSKSLPNLAESALPTAIQSTSSPPFGTPEPVVSRSRIDNIMKQFQFNRMREFDGNAAQNEAHSVSQVSNTLDSVIQEPRPLPRHGALPPLPSSTSLTSNTSLPTQNSPFPSQNSPFPSHNSPFPTQNSQFSSNDHDERSLNDRENGSGFGRIEETKRRHKLSTSEVLPPIRSPSPPKSPKSTTSVTSKIVNNIKPMNTKTSWLPDPTANLSIKEKNFILVISGMGFPKARTARAVERLKDDQKEILDFLVRVQQITDMGYDADDVEMALINNKDDSESVMSYLMLVNKWKELGFPIQKIHDALKNTDRENEEPMYSASKSIPVSLSRSHDPNSIFQDNTIIITAIDLL